MAAKDRDVLPDTVKPVHYGISLRDLEFGGGWKYKGLVKIDTRIIKATKEIVLNAKGLDIQRAKLWTAEAKSGSRIENEQSAEASKISYDKKSARVTLNFPSEILPSQALLEIDFTGILNSNMAGFYRSKYKPAVTPAASVAKDNEGHYMISTHFEACDARQAFPCFDEPNLKATFDFEIEIPEDQVALSNMPEKSVVEAKGKSGYKVVSFERTPLMSTYLLAWAVGDFEYVESFTQRKYNGKNLPVRVYTTRGLKEQARFALENAHQIVDYFSEVFQIDYPLPKVDMLAVHEFTIGAMENWGLLTYRTTAVLFDEGKSDARYKNRIAYVVAHELAHQWFGNLVTMDWWNELWLKEGFATWMGWYTVDHLYPEWNVWARFVAEGVQPAFQLDSLRASHPIEVPVRDALDICQIFDSINYLKGSSVIRMLSTHLGVRVFLQGASEYLKAHAYGNATTNDLWSALTEASGTDVRSFMDLWIRKIGFPEVTVAEGPGQITVRQARFLLTGDVKPEDDETTWWIPLGIKSGSKSAEAKNVALTTKEQTIKDVDDAFYKLNTNNAGFYRTNYPAERLARLGQAQERLSVEDKIGLIGDAAALAIAGDGTTAGLLAFVEGFKDESDYLVWSQITTCLANLRSIFADNEAVADGLKNFTLKLTASAVEKIGWKFPDGEDHLPGQLRSLLITVAGGAGHESTIAEAKRQFELFASGKDKDAIHPSLRSAVFRIAIAEGGEPEYNAVKDEYLTGQSVDGKEICLLALGQSKLPAVVNNFLEFNFSKTVATQDIHSGATSLALNPKARGPQWEWIKKNWNKVYERLSVNFTLLDRFLRLSLKQFSDHKVEQDIAAFFKEKDNCGYDQALGVISDTVRGNANYKQRDEALILGWLKAHGYA